MKKLVFLVASLCLVAGISTSCASAIVNKQNKNEAVILERAKKLELAFVSGDVDTIWEMSAPTIKENNSKDEYNRFLSTFLKGADYSSSKPVLIVLGEKYAITQNQSTFTVKSNKKEIFTLCRRTMWFKYPDNWYWDSNSRTCDYMLSDEEIRSLTDHLK